MEVNYAWWGREEYHVDGRLIEKRWNASFSGQRRFRVGSHSVRIEVSQGQRQYFTRVFVDDTLHVEELFPTAKAQFQRWERLPYRVVVLWAVVIAVLVALSLSGVLPR
jgi:hypothetical protein